MKNLLKDLGLTTEQIDIYESLLSNGSQSATELAKTTKVKRTYVYIVCAELIKLGLIHKSSRGQITLFVANSPEKLLSLAKTQKEQAEQAEITLETLLPTLASKYQLLENKPVVTYYEGVEGVKKVYLDTIREKQSILALVETSQVDPEIYDWATQKYTKLRQGENISVKAIVSSGSKTEKYVQLNQEELRETKVIASESFPFKNEINIYGSKIAIINHRRGTQLLGIIIDNQIVAETFRSWFNLTWSLLPDQTLDTQI